MSWIENKPESLLIQIQGWVEGVCSKVLAFLVWAHGWFNQLEYLTPEEAKGIASLIVVVVAFIVVATWMRAYSAGYFRTACVSLFVPALVLLFLLIPPSFVGGPDDNCPKYRNGKLPFTYIDSFEMSVKASEPYGATWFILIVRAEERWGNDPHQCRLLSSNPKTQELKVMLTQALSAGGSQFSDRGGVVFTFGGNSETPNVTWSPTDPTQKKPYPPEKPPGSA